MSGQIGLIEKCVVDLHSHYDCDYEGLSEIVIRFVFEHGMIDSEIVVEYLKPVILFSNENDISLMESYECQQAVDMIVKPSPTPTTEQLAEQVVVEMIKINEEYSRRNRGAIKVIVWSCVFVVASFVGALINPTAGLCCFLVFLMIQKK